MASAGLRDKLARAARSLLGARGMSTSTLDIRQAVAAKIPEEQVTRGAWQGQLLPRRMPFSAFLFQALLWPFSFRKRCGKGHRNAEMSPAVR